MKTPLFALFRHFAAFLLTWAFLATPQAQAVPAPDTIFNLQQPDGVVFEARARGSDEFSWFETTAGYPINQDPATQEWRYLDPLFKDTEIVHLTALRAEGPPPEGGPWSPEASEEPATAAEGPEFQAPFVPVPQARGMYPQNTPTTPPPGESVAAETPPSSFGEGRLAVLCARFADMAAQPVKPVLDYYNRLFVKTPGLDQTMRDLYWKMSYGNFDVTGGPSGVMGWYTVSGTRASYGAHDPNNDKKKDVNAAGFVQEVVQQADGVLNFGPYDTNNDGFVDCVALVAQGLPEESGGGKNAFWSHQSTITPLATNDVNAEGEPVFVSRYFIVSELLLAQDDDDETPLVNERRIETQTIGVFAHEYGHALGLPDLYDRTGKPASNGLGSWSLMAGGSWNSRKDPGDCPAWMDAWSRKKLGWANVVNVTLNTMGMRIPNVQDDWTVYRLWTNGNLGPQYFLIENRQAMGFDANLPGNASGLHIYHVDETMDEEQNDNAWWYRTANSKLIDKGHYLVAMEQADGLYNLERTLKYDETTKEGTNGGDREDVWKKGQTFDTDSAPSSRKYNADGTNTLGDPSYVAVRNIGDIDYTGDRSITADLIISSNEFATTTITLPAEPVGDVIPVYQTMTQFEGTAFDDDAWGTGVWEVQVYLRELKPDGRYWKFTTNEWQSTYSELQQKGVAAGTGGLNWARPMHDPALSDGVYEVKARSRDAGGQLGPFVTRQFRIQRDMTAPEATISSPGESPLSAVPTMTGTATDAGGIQEKRFALFSHTQGKWLKWSPAPGALDSGTFSAADHIMTQTDSTSPWSVTLPPLLPNGDYQFFVEAVDTTNQASGWRDRHFTLQVAPKVALTGPLHASYRNSAPVITGTAQPGAGATLVANRVTLVIQRGEQWWDGDSWENSLREVHADVSGGTWSYPATSSDAVANAPTGDGGFTVTVTATDSLGRTSLPVQPGLSGNTIASFIVDTVPPTLDIESPTTTPPTVITGPPLPDSATLIHGSAHDSSGRPVVKVTLKRVADDMYWSGLNWFSNPAQAVIPGHFGGEDMGSRTDWTCSLRLPRLGIREGSLKNGTYEVTAVARDAAGNESTETTSFTVNWNPVWMRPQDTLAQLQPEQTAPIDGGTVGSSVHQTYSPRAGPADDQRGFVPTTFGQDGAGNTYVISRSNAPLGYFNGANSAGVFQRLGAGGWRRERQVSTSGDPFNLTYHESWGAGTSTVIPAEEGYGRCDFVHGTVDAAGNTYAVYMLRQTNYIVLYTTGALIVKFDPAGNLLWRNMIETSSAVQRILPAPDGGAWLVLGNAYLQSIEYGYSMTEVIKVSSGGSEGPVAVHGQLDGGDYDPAVWATHLFSEVDPSGNIFHAVTEDTIGGTGAIQVLYKHSATGAQLAKLEVDPGETPEQWLTMKTDAAGNLYVASMFDVSETDRRICLSRYNSSLELQWRAFGPPHSMSYNPNTAWWPLMQITAHGITLSYGSPGQGYYSEFPYEHGEFARFSTSGDLLWTRGIKGGTATVLHGDAIHSFQVDNAGNVLFLAAFNHPVNISDYHYGKLTSSGDLQFIRPAPGLLFYLDGNDFTRLYQGTQLMVLNQNYSSGTPPDDLYEVSLFSNPANQLVPVTLDVDHPADLLAIEGAAAQLRVINRGSAATYQWRKEDNLGVPQNITGATLDRLIFATTIAADAGEYSVVVTNAVDSSTSRTATVTVLPSVALDVALDTPGRTWTTGGTKPWVGFGSTSLAHDTVDAAMPNNLSQGENAWLETTVTGPITVSFWWKSSTPSFSDFFDFSVDGDSVNFINGEQDWALFQHSVGAGSHTLRWSFSKSSPVTVGTHNTVFLDQVSFISTPEIAVELDSPFEDLSDNTNQVGFITALPGGNSVRSFTIRNNGSAQLSNLVLSKTGTNAADFTYSPLSSVTVEPGGTATFSVTFAPASPGAKTASLMLTSNDTDETPFDIHLSGTGGIPITTWRQTHFGTTANTGNAADDADADGDGVLNLLEFATNGDPGASTGQPGEMAPVDNSGLIFFTYIRNKQAMAEITFQVEWTDDFAIPWSSIDVTESIMSDNGLVQTVTAMLPSGTSGHRFVRLRVSR
ncbi:MAG: M6 family metalloprotease domain-containing protein [Prosthecobacter sp.]